MHFSKTVVASLFLSLSTAPVITAGSYDSVKKDASTIVSAKDKIKLTAYAIATAIAAGATGIFVKDAATRGAVVIKGGFKLPFELYQRTPRCVEEFGSHSLDLFGYVVLTTFSGTAALYFGEKTKEAYQEESK